MKPNGRRAWRRFAKQQRRKVNRRNRQTGTPWINDADGAFYRHEQKHFEQRPIVPVGPFTAHSLVGMTMGARKRVLQDELSRYIGDDDFDYGDVVAHFADPLRIGERLRPCPGCPKCGVLRFRRIGGFGDNTACVEHRLSTGQSRLIRSIGIPWRYSRDRRRSKSAPFHPLDRCVELVDAGQWTLDPELCDGSGVLPARKAKR